MNKVILMGRLVRDPEVRYTIGEKVVCNFTVAVDRGTKDISGKKETDFIPCVAWGKTGELIGNYFSQGNKILLEGKMQIKKYEDKQGVKRSQTYVNVFAIDFIDNPKETHQPPAQNHSQAKPGGFESMGTAMMDDLDGLNF